MHNLAPQSPVRHSPDESRLRYTLDGKIPGATSLRYDKPFIINDSVVVKAAIFREGKILGPILERNVGTEKEIRNYFEYVEPEHWKNVKQ